MAKMFDANNVLEHLKQAEKEMMVVTALGCKAVDIKAVIHYIESVPTVDAVEVVHGRWVGSGQWNHNPYRMKNKEKWQTYLCSECGHSNGRRFNDNYCPNCGAKMRGSEE